MFTRPRKDSHRSTSSRRDSESRRNKEYHFGESYTESPPQYQKSHRSTRSREEVRNALESKANAAEAKWTEVYGEVAVEEKVTVTLEMIQTTFENLKSVLEESEGDSFSKSSVLSMIVDIYNWQVFDKDHQITVPVPLGSNSVRKMWPHGSVVDTRKKINVAVGGSSARRLKDVGEDHVSTVASSVVSSVKDEEKSNVRKGTVMSMDNRGILMPVQEVHDSSPGLQQGYHKFPHGNYGNHITQEPVTMEHHHQSPLFYPPNQYRPLPVRQSSAPAARYSLSGNVVEPPVEVVETPVMENAAPVKRKVVRRVRAGASSRQNTSGEGGEEVSFAE